MLAAIDIGNTNITVGFYDGDMFSGTYRIITTMKRTSDEYGVLFLNFLTMAGHKPEDIKDCIISSVVPKVNYAFSSAIIKVCGINPLFIGPGVKSGIKVSIDHPSALGPDRLVDAAGAHYTYGGDCLVIDFGTATTFDVVTAEGEFIGGAISAGIGITAATLTSQAAQLPEIEIFRPEHVIGKNTVLAMQSGVVYGYIGQTEYIIHKIKKEFGKPLTVISTGGYGKVISGQTNAIDIFDDDLTFKGLKVIYDKNKKLRKGA